MYPTSWKLSKESKLRCVSVCVFLGWQMLSMAQIVDKAKDQQLEDGLYSRTAFILDDFADSLLQLRLRVNETGVFESA